MRILSFVSLLLVFMMASCKKSDDCGYSACDNKAPDSEIASLQTYITNNGITATQHCSGLFYRIEREGGGSSVDPCSNVRASYKGMLTNGTVFDQGTLEFNLMGTIRGWRNGVPLIRTGGRIVLYIPPSLGYGPQGDPPTIPPNSIMIFEIELQ